MELKDLQNMLENKIVIGEYGAFTRPYVVLDIDEYQALLEELKARRKRREVPRESARA